MGKIIPDGMMLGTTVVPESQGIGLPLHSAGKPGRRLDMAEQQIQQGITLAAAETLDMTGKTGIYIQQLPPGFRVGDNHRVLVARILALSRGYFVTAKIRQGTIMHRRQAFKHAF